MDELLEKNDLTTLRSNDQLVQAQDNKAAFVGFEEGWLGFRPTYKFDKTKYARFFVFVLYRLHYRKSLSQCYGTSNANFNHHGNRTELYDTSKKRRVPAWTDRVLYWHRPDSDRVVALGSTGAEGGIRSGKWLELEQY
eukprot:SAG31_NODE_1054_length_10140_cov_4.264316_19_plen_137_part_01